MFCTPVPSGSTERVATTGIGGISASKRISIQPSSGTSAPGRPSCVQEVHAASTNDDTAAAYMIPFIMSVDFYDSYSMSYAS